MSTCPFKVGDRIVYANLKPGTIKIINPPEFTNNRNPVIVSYDDHSLGTHWKGIYGAALLDWDELIPIAEWIQFDMD